MQAVVITDGELEWRTRPDPVPGDTELLVSVRAAGINNADLLQRRGHYPAPPGSPPDVPGLELAGEVVSVGRQVTRFAVGDRVMAVVGGGGQATLAVVDETHALPVPGALSWGEAGGFPEVFSTAWDAIGPQAHLAAGERLLVTGAAGGVGTAAVQLASASGSLVVASVRDPSRRDAVSELGAHRVIDPTEVPDHGPYDAILELVGAPSLAASLGSLAIGGRVVVIGVGAGPRLELDLLALMAKRAWIGSSTLRARDRVGKAIVANEVASHVLPLLSSGAVRVPVCDTFPMSEAASAYERFGVGSKLGKVVLVP